MTSSSLAGSKGRWQLLRRSSKEKECIGSPGKMQVPRHWLIRSLKVESDKVHSGKAH